jgi:hypothetical protein
MTTRTKTATGASTVSRDYIKLSGSDIPKYSSGEITSAYLLRDGSVVGYCKTTKEWLKWNSKGQLNTSCSKTRDEAVLLDGQWMTRDDDYTPPERHSARVRAIVARRDARHAKRRADRQRMADIPARKSASTQPVRTVMLPVNGALIEVQEEPATKRGGIELLDEAYQQQNFHARYMNVTAITSTGSPISTQHWCASNDDIMALHHRIISWTSRVDGEPIERVWLFDTFTKQLHELVIVGDKFTKAPFAGIDHLVKMLQSADRVCTKAGHEWGWQLMARNLLKEVLS